MSNTQFSDERTIDVRDVTQRVEELRDQQEDRIVVGRNLPGFAVADEKDTQEFTDWNEARNALADMIQEDTDQLASEGAPDSRISGMEDQVKNLRESNEDEDFNVVLGPYNYFIVQDGQILSDEDDREELRLLEELLENIRGYGGDHQWEGSWFPLLLIREDYFPEYCEELCKDIGDVPKDIPGYLVIDWEATARNIRFDYSEVDFDGETYLYR